MTSSENKNSSQYSMCSEFNFTSQSLQNRFRNDVQLKDKTKLFLSKMPKQPPTKTAYKKVCKVYVDLFPKNFSKAQLESLLSPFGELDICHIEPDRTEGANISFGFVVFKKEESVARAVEGLKNHLEGENEIYIGIAPKYRRGKGGRRDRANIKSNSNVRRSANLKIRGLPADYTDKKLKELISYYDYASVAKVQPAENDVSEMVGIVKLGNSGMAETIKSALDGFKPPGFTKPISVSSTIFSKNTTWQTAHQTRRKRGTQSIYMPRRHHGMVYGWHDYYCHPSKEHQPTWKDRWTT